MNTVRTSMLHGTHSIKKKSPGKEENELHIIVSELKKLEHDFSTDVAVLREQIELACLDFTEAQKRFDRLEKDYVAAKCELFVKKERKEQLTAHLCTFIKQNEIEKAKTISGMVGKLELAPCPLEKPIRVEREECNKQDDHAATEDSPER
uniref:RAB6-interacting golgin n=1 Tax=Lygus hesperus TaxID=30085 RepID=A0A146LMD2_LYGHE